MTSTFHHTYLCGLTLILFAWTPYYLVASNAHESSTPPYRMSFEEAILYSLIHQPQIGIHQAKLAEVNGQALQSAAPFDVNLGSSISYSRDKYPVFLKANPTAGTIQEEEFRQLSFEASRLLRNGIQLGPELTVTDYDNNRSLLAPSSTSNLAMRVRIPLLQGRGSANRFTASEHVAQLELTAEAERLKIAVDTTLLATAQTFWATLAAQETLAVLKDTSARAQELSRIVGRLLDAGIVDSATLAHAEAQLRNYDREIQAAELNFSKMRYRLAQALGFSREAIATPPEIEGTFPNPDFKNPWAQNGAFLIGQALQKRGDYQAVLLAVEQGDILVRSSANSRLPTLDLNASLGYAGVSATGSPNQRIGESATNSLTGLNGGISLDFSFPVQNSAGEGAWHVRRAQKRQAEHTAESMAQIIATEVLESYATLRSKALELDHARQSENSFKIAADSLLEKIKRGEASVSDIVNIEEQLLAARLASLESQRAYSTELARIRVVTGDLVQVSDEELNLNTANLLIPPQSVF